MNIKSGLLFFYLLDFLDEVLSGLCLLLVVARFLLYNLGVLRVKQLQICLKSISHINVLLEALIKGHRGETVLLEKLLVHVHEPFPNQGLYNNQRSVFLLFLV